MKNNSEAPKHNSEMLDEYDFSNGVRGKYAHLHTNNRAQVKVKISSSTLPNKEASIKEETDSMPKDP